MSFAALTSRANHGLQAPTVHVEAHVGQGQFRFNLAGLPEAAVKESKHRVLGALANCGYTAMLGPVTVNLAPADLPKDGGRFDLPIALSIIAAIGYLKKVDFTQYEFAAELGLSGQLRPVRGVLPMGIACKKAGRTLIVAKENAAELKLIQGLRFLSLAHMSDVIAHLTGEATQTASLGEALGPTTCEYPDFANVLEQSLSKRALEIAAAGGHHVLMSGPPGSGKSLLASCFPSILPKPSLSEAEEIAAVYSLTRQGFSPETWQQRPFRSPHHTASAPALVGGGNPPAPGEISLAHHGVLFLDELPEFSRQVLETLREPLETSHIHIARAGRQMTFPAAFSLIAAMNPCPCGHYGNPHKVCHCSEDRRKRYLQRISGPLLDRIDMLLEVVPVTASSLVAGAEGCESSTVIKERVVAARTIQLQRQDKLNSQLLPREIAVYCALTDKQQQELTRAFKRFNLTARSFHRVLRLARSMADLAGRARIEDEDLFSALGFRRHALLGS